MKTKTLARTAAAVLFAGAVAIPAASADETTLNVVTAGSQNMVDYVTDYLGPMYEAENSGAKVRGVGTGPGSAGSQKIAEKLYAQKDAGKDKWDIDVAVVHQKMAAELVQKGVLAKFRNDVSTGKLVTASDAKNAIPQRRFDRQAGHRVRREKRFGHQCGRLCIPDVPQPDGYRLQPCPGQIATEELRRTRHMGERKPEEIRLQWHQACRRCPP
jgi:hypothetical protein